MITTATKRNIMLKEYFRFNYKNLRSNKLTPEFKNLSHTCICYQYPLKWTYYKRINNKS